MTGKHPDIRPGFDAEAVTHDIVTDFHSLDDLFGDVEWTDIQLQEVRAEIDHRLDHFVHYDNGDFDSLTEDEQYAIYTYLKVEEAARTLTVPETYLMERIAERNTHVIREEKERAYREGEMVLVNNPSLEKYRFEGVAFVGDSVMSMTSYKGRTIDSELPPYSAALPGTLDLAHGGRMLVPHELQETDAEYVRDVGSNIEEKVFGILDDDTSPYGTIVLNGGFNDIWNRTLHGDNPEDVAEAIIDSYTRIIDEAHKLGIQIVLFTMIVHRKFPADDPRNIATERVNAWIRDECDSDIVIDADILEDSEVAGDGFHPNERGKKRLYELAKERTIEPSS